MDSWIVRTGCWVVIGLLSPVTVVGQQQIAQDSTRRQQPDSARLVLPPIVITGTRAPTRASDAVFATSVLGSMALQREPTSFATTALSRLPSVQIDEDAGVGGPTVLRLRGGEETFTQVMFDGVPINLTGGFLDLQGVTLTNVERVEVARGPQSVMYGSSAMSGVVQFITREGQPGRSRVTFTGEAGVGAANGEGRARSEVDVSGGSDLMRYSIGAGGNYARGIYALPQDLRTWDGSARFDLHPAPTWNVTATTRYMNIASKLPVRDAGVTRVPLDPNRRDARNRLLASVGARFTATPTWRHDLVIKAARDGSLFEDQADGLNPADYPFFVFDFDFGQTSVQWRESGEYTGTVDVVARQSAFTLAYGGRFERETYHVEQTGDFGDSKNAYGRNNGAGFTEIQGRIADRVDLLAGVRYERFQGLPGDLLPRGGVAVAVIPGIVKVRASAGRAFKAPNLDQQFLESPFVRPNPNLKPETSVSWETGFIAMVQRLGLTAQGTFFHQTYYDLIRFVPLDTTGVAQNQNLGKSRVLGVELELDKWWDSRWHAGAGATWLHSEMVENTGLPNNLYPVGSALLGVPNWTGNAMLDGDLTSVFSVSVRGRLVGKREVFSERFSGNRVEIDPYFVLGLTIRADVSSRLEAYAQSENLLNTSYATAYDRPGLPRTVFAGLRVTVH